VGRPGHVAAGEDSGRDAVLFRNDVATDHLTALLITPLLDAGEAGADDLEAEDGTGMPRRSCRTASTDRGAPATSLS
jgi:hypothetical protein